MSDWTTYGDVVRDENGYSVCITHGRLPDTRLALAEKIVLSVNSHDEMLEALKRADEMLRSSDLDKEAVCDHSVGICWCDYNCIREAMKTAIAKAEGKS